MKVLRDLMTSVEEKDRTIISQRDEITTMKKIQNE
jgi:hypothetical protein